jgi:hypothetical protein
MIEPDGCTLRTLSARVTYKPSVQCPIAPHEPTKPPRERLKVENRRSTHNRLNLFQPVIYCSAQSRLYIEAKRFLSPCLPRCSPNPKDAELVVLTPLPTPGLSYLRPFRRERPPRLARCAASVAPWLVWPASVRQPQREASVKTLPPRLAQSAPSVAPWQVWHAFARKPQRKALEKTLPPRLAQSAAFVSPRQVRHAFARRPQREASVKTCLYACVCVCGWGSLYAVASSVVGRLHDGGHACGI